MPSTRQLAVSLLEEWARGEQHAVSILDQYALGYKLAGRDTAMLQSLVFGVLRNMTLLDHWAAELSNGRSIDTGTRTVVRLGLAQLLLLEMSPHAAVNETVALAGHARGFVNAILRRADRERVALLGQREALPTNVRCSHPRWLVQRWEQQYGIVAAAAICAWNQLPAPVIVRANGLAKVPFVPGSDASAVGASIASLKSLAGSFYLCPTLPREALAAGQCYAQDPSTALAPLLLAPQSGDAVLDACAAPGGKTAILAQLMRNEGKIIATDVSMPRLQRLSDNLDRMQVTNVQALRHDWADGNSLPPKVTANFDRILLDVPCSNTGVMRRRIDVRWRIEPETFAAQARTQLDLLQACILALKPGGTLVYSTCSIDREENEGVIERALANTPGLKLVETQQLLPHRDGVDGAFAAKLTK